MYTVSGEEVVSTTYIFLEITSSVLVTSSGNITVTGQPTLIDGPTTKAVQLNGIDQYIDLTANTDACIFNPASCKLGLSAAFTLKVLELKEDMYIFTSGGDSVEGQGVAMYYRRGFFFLTVSTENREWTVSVPKAKLMVNVYVSIEFSWSLQTGLELLLDGQIVAQTTTYIQRRTVTVNTFSTFFVGRSLGLQLQVYSKIIIESWTFTVSTRLIREVVLAEETTTVSATTEIESTTTDITTDSSVSTTDAESTTESMSTSIEESTTTPVSSTTETYTATDGESTITPVSSTTESARTTDEESTMTSVSSTTETYNATGGESTTSSISSTAETDSTTDLTEGKLIDLVHVHVFDFSFVSISYVQMHPSVLPDYLCMQSVLSKEICVYCTKSYIPCIHSLHDQLLSNTSFRWQSDSPTQYSLIRSVTHSFSSEITWNQLPLIDIS